MDATVQGSSFDRKQYHLARQIAIKTSQYGGIENAPGNDRKQGGCVHKAAEFAKLASLDAASALEHTVPRLNLEKAVDHNGHEEHDVKPTSHIFPIAHPMGEL